MSRRPSLLAAAIKTTEQPAPEPADSAVSREENYIAPSRVNKAARTHFLPPAYWETLDEISFRSRDAAGKRISRERLVAEALNLLFLKHNYPQVTDSE